MRAIVKLLSVPAGNDELVKAQYRAFSRQIPMMYFILMCSTWALAATHMRDAPLWLTAGIPALFTSLCAVRVANWWRIRDVDATAQEAMRQLNRTNRLAAFIAIAFVSWSFLLFAYGDAYTKSHVAFYMAITVISCIFCLMHLRSAALIVTAIVNGAFIVFFAASGQPTFVAIAVNVLFVCLGMLVILNVNYRNFERMVLAQQRAEALGAENLRLANLDSLTELPNRRAFLASLSSTFAEARENGRRMAVGIIDLDGFKPVNDLYGHSTGDRLLVEIGRRLRDAAPGMIVARLGGDEFAFAIPDAAPDAALVGWGDGVCAALRLPVVLPEATVMVSGSAGIAVYPDMASSPEELFDRADYALYQSKRHRRGHTVLFAAHHDAEIHRDAKIEQILKQADLEAELSVVFQPIVDIRTQDTVGFEALARWDSPVMGRVPPARFIPIAERSGIIGSLTQPLLRKALAEAVRWPEHIRLSFNLSAHDINNAEAVIRVIATIRASGFDPHRLDVELTETAFAHDIEQVHRSVEMLHRLGCGIALDDFGTGYSSLTSLHELPLTKFKIDRSFVTNLDNTPRSYNIVKSLLALSRNMGIECVIEGVETQQELGALRELGGNLLQGYVYSPPIAAGEVAGFLAEGPAAARPPASL